MIRETTGVWHEWPLYDTTGSRLYANALAFWPRHQFRPFLVIRTPEKPIDSQRRV